MKFRTHIDIEPFPDTIGYLKPVMMIGSCFTENIGQKLTELKFQTDINPFGIIYNPASISGAIRDILSEKSFNRSDLFFHNGLWHSYSHHGRFSNSDPERCLESINNRVRSGTTSLKSAKFLILTFGTAWVYKLKKGGQIVANCHKIPEKQFERVRLTPEEIVEDYKLLLNDLKRYNPDIKILFNVSPIRHQKDGAIENQRSKATLILAIDKIIKKCIDLPCYYFPSYEIVMDELRDYRFYDSDMIHLSDVAIDYIWTKFRELLIDEESNIISKEVSKICKLINHKPINKNSKEYILFLNQSIDKIDKLQKKNPYLDLASEMDHFKKLLKEIKLS